MGLISRAEAEVAPKTIQARGAKSHGPDQPSAGLRQGLCCNAMGLISLSLKAVGPLFLLLSPQLPCCTPAACAAAPTRPELAPERGPPLLGPSSPPSAVTCACACGRCGAGGTTEAAHGRSGWYKRNEAMGASNGGVPLASS
jgi:hypothetical protein